VKTGRGGGGKFVSKGATKSVRETKKGVRASRSVVDGGGFDFQEEKMKKIVYLASRKSHHVKESGVKGKFSVRF